MRTLGRYAPWIPAGFSSYLHSSYLNSLILNLSSQSWVAVVGTKFSSRSMRAGPVKIWSSINNLMSSSNFANAVSKTSRLRRKILLKGAASHLQMLLYLTPIPWFHLKQHFKPRNSILRETLPMALYCKYLTFDPMSVYIAKVRKAGLVDHRFRAWLECK